MQRYLIIAAVILVVALYMTTDTVRFTETAVVTTFGKAGDGDVRTEPGLLFTVPWAQRVTKYDKRARFLETLGEMQQTRDQRQIVSTVFLTWEVSDPLAFYRRFSGAGDRPEEHYREAEKTLMHQLRSAVLAEFGRYRLSELLSPVPGDSKLAQLESGVLARLQAGSAGETPLEAYGIRAVTVGIGSMTFPQDTTREVFKAMRSNRTTIATEAKSQGESRAATIRSQAESDAKRILAFADTLAKSIRGRGDAEAAQYVAQMKEEPELAIFLQNIQFMRDTIGRQFTLVLPTNLPGIQLLRPDAMGDLFRRAAAAPSAGDIAGATRAIGAAQQPQQQEAGR